MNSNKILLLLAVTGMIPACGITKSKYVPYKETAASGGSCDAAKTAFTDNVAPYVPKNCTACHLAGGSGSSSLLFKEGDNDSNSAALKAKKGGTANGIYTYITSSSHSGSSSVGDLTEAKLDTWLKAEAACP